MKKIIILKSLMMILLLSGKQKIRVDLLMTVHQTMSQKTMVKKLMHYVMI